MTAKHAQRMGSQFTARKKGVKTNKVLSYTCTLYLPLVHELVQNLFHACKKFVRLGK